MQQLKRLLYVLIHLTAWGIPILVLELLGDEKNVGIFNSGDFEFFYPIYYGVALSAVFFYTVVYWIMPRVLKKRGVLSAFLGAFVAYLIHTVLESGIDFGVAYCRDMLSDPSLMVYGIVGNFIINLLVFLIAIGYFFIDKLILSERRELKIREEKLQLEIDFLRAQLNPHFLFNVLNTLFGTARKNGCDDTADGIAQLSGLMRYMLQESNNKFVSLESEVQYLNNYIKLQKRRFSNEDDISLSFTVKGSLDDKWIAPMILITFVENAFMHGIKFNASSYIDIKLKIDKNSVLFTVFNSHPSFSEQVTSHGIGLANTRKRLDLIYQDSYHLQIGNQPGQYSISLCILEKV